MIREHFLAIKAQGKPWMKLINTEVSTEKKKPEMHILLVSALNLQSYYVQMINIITSRMYYFSRVVIIFVFNFQLKQLTATKINTVTGIYFDIIIVFSFFFLFSKDKVDMLEWQNANTVNSP